MSASITSGTYPRASQTFASGGLRAVGLSIWNTLAHVGAYRARPELLRLARLHEASDPALAGRLRSAADQLLNG